jgi:hypothetical protein
MLKPYIGQSVVTRRGKRGTVVAIGEGTIDVKFGGKVFTMKDTAVVSDSAYRGMQTAANIAASNQRYNARIG